MLLLLNLALPWLLLAAAAFFGNWLLDPNLWVLQGLHPQTSLYGIPTLTSQFGLVGLMIPLAIVHNLAYLVVRLIQARIDLEFLPMIRSWLAWIASAFVAYWLWLSFVRGAKFGELHPLVLTLLPFVALITGLAFFVFRAKGRGAAQITAIFVMMAPYLSLMASLTGNRLRPQSLFSEVTVEPGGAVKGFDKLDEKTRREGYLKLVLAKEGNALRFPSLARDLKVQIGSDKKVSRFESGLDTVAAKDLLALPEHLEAAGWRAQGQNAKALADFCAKAPAKGKVSKKGPKILEWTQSDAVLTITVERCKGQAKWSVAAKTTLVPLGSLNIAKANEIKHDRETSNLSLKQIDQALLADKDWRQRKLGLSLLATVNDPAAIPLLSRGFYDRDVEVRRAAGLGLLSWGSKAQDYLAKALTDPNPFMRGDALKILALSQHRTPHPAAFKLIADPSPYVRVSAVQALAPLVADSVVLKTLMRVFDAEYDKAPKPITAAFLNDPFVSELVVAIARAEDVRTAPTLLRAMSKNISAEGDRPGQAEYEAAHSLRGMKNWLGVDYLQAIVKRSPNLENRQKALAIMAHWREPGDEWAYVKALQDPQLQPFALSLAKSFKGDVVYRELIKLVGSASEIAALESLSTQLAQYRQPASVEALLNRARTLEQRDPKKLESLAKGLGMMWEVSLPEIKSLQKDPSSELRLVAVLAAKYGKGPGREPILKTASADKDPLVSSRAKEILKADQAK